LFVCLILLFLKFSAKSNLSRFSCRVNVFKRFKHCPNYLRSFICAPTSRMKPYVLHFKKSCRNWSNSLLTFHRRLGRFSNALWALHRCKINATKWTLFFALLLIRSFITWKRFRTIWSLTTENFMSLFCLNDRRKCALLPSSWSAISISPSHR